MSGETNLDRLLQSIQPILDREEYVFCSINNYDNSYSYLDFIGLFKEKEGTTLILEKDRADAAGLSYTAVFALITLSVHSSLEAVGFIAAITNKLAKHNISVNPVSAYYHDHLFVPVSHARETIVLLHEFSKQPE